MPASYTHHLIAKQAFDALPIALQRKLEPYFPLYYFGAQGADFCFFYPVVDGKNSANLGSFLHRKGGFGAFAVCKAFSYSQTALFAYALGYITHYAADVTFHPYVYATAGRSPLRHTRIEGALDGYFKSIYASADDVSLRYLGKKPPKAQVDELFLLYAAIAANAGFPPLQKTAFLRAITLFNAYLPRIPALLSAKKTPQIENLVNVQNRAWTYPCNKSVVSHDGGKELLEKSVHFSLSAIDEFVNAVQKRAPLSFATFGKNYLSGL